MQILSGALPFYSKDSWQPKQFRGLALPMQKKKNEIKHPKRFCDRRHLEKTLYKRRPDWKYAVTVGPGSDAELFMSRT